MSDYDKPGKGTVFAREKKNDRSPVMGGDGVCPHCETKLDLAFWVVADRETGEVRRDRRNKPFYNLSLTVADDATPAKPKPAPADDDEGDGLPF